MNSKMLEAQWRKLRKKDKALEERAFLLYYLTIRKITENKLNLFGVDLYEVHKKKCEQMYDGGGAFK